jgi:hypothetical protein
MDTPQNDDFFVLAFDHRGPIQRGLYNIHDRAATPEEETKVRDRQEIDLRSILGPPRSWRLRVRILAYSLTRNSVPRLSVAMRKYPLVAS